MPKFKKIFTFTSFINLVFFILLNNNFAVSADSFNGIEIKFLDQLEAKAFLQEEDQFVAALSTFDIALRLSSYEKTSKAEYLDFVSKQVLKWYDDEKQIVRASIRRINKILNLLSLPKLKAIYLLKGSDLSEFGRPYTRRNAIILNQSFFTCSFDQQTEALFHELFHVLSRNDLSFRTKMYNLINFKEFEGIEYPNEFNLLTNPAGYYNTHYITVRVAGLDYKVIPALYTTHSLTGLLQESVKDIIDFFTLKLLAIDKSENTWVYLRDSENEIIRFDVSESNFLKLVGQNTDYIIHPDEIMAEHFVLLFRYLKNQGIINSIPNPEIVLGMKERLIQK